MSLSKDSRYLSKETVYQTLRDRLEAQAILYRTHRGRSIVRTGMTIKDRIMGRTSGQKAIFPFILSRLLKMP